LPVKYNAGLPDRRTSKLSVSIGIGDQPKADQNVF